MNLMGSPSPICISTSLLCWFWIDSSYSALTAFMPKCAVKMDMVRVDRLVSELSLKKMVSNHLTHAYSENSWLHQGCIQKNYFLKESFWLAHQQGFLEHWHALNGSTSFDLVDLTFSVSTHGVKLWANHMGYTLGTWWEHIGNKKKKQKIPLWPTPQK